MAGRSKHMRLKQSYVNHIDANTAAGPMKMGTAPSVGITRHYWHNYQTECNQRADAVKKSYANVVQLNINPAHTPVGTCFNVLRECRETTVPNMFGTPHNYGQSSAAGGACDECPTGEKGDTGDTGADGAAGASVTGPTGPGGSFALAPAYDGDYIVGDGGVFVLGSTVGTADNVYLGHSAGSGATTAQQCIFLGLNSGAGANTINSIAIGINCGINAASAVTAVGANFCGNNAAANATCFGSGAGSNISQSAVAIGVNAGINAFSGAVSIGAGAGGGVFNNQGRNSVCIGAGAGTNALGSGAVVIGVGAGAGGSGAGVNSVCVGPNAGSASASTQMVIIGADAGIGAAGHAVVIGSGAGVGINNSAVAIGKNAGSAAAANAVVIGSGAGTTISQSAVAIGVNAGSNAASGAISIGASAGTGFFSNQGPDSVCIGSNAGTNLLGSGAVVVGVNAGAGGSAAGINSVCIGANAGNGSAVANCVCIGADAGNGAQAANSIVINATGVALVNGNVSSCTISPIRLSSTTTSAIQTLVYDPTTAEIFSNNSLAAYGQYYYQQLSISPTGVATNTTTPEDVATLALPAGNRRWFMQATIASDFTSATAAASAKATLCLLDGSTVIEPLTLKQSTNNYLSGVVRSTITYDTVFSDWFDLSAVATTGVHLGLFWVNTDSAPADFVISMQMFSYA